MTVIERAPQHPGDTYPTLAVACAQADEGADLIVARPWTYRAERTGPR